MLKHVEKTIVFQLQCLSGHQPFREIGAMQILPLY